VLVNHIRAKQRFSFNRHSDPSADLQPQVIFQVLTGTGTPL
jgi:hypothetical protein